MDGTSAATRLAAGRHNPANQETEMTTSNSTMTTRHFSGLTAGEIDELIETFSDRCHDWDKVQGVAQVDFEDEGEVEDFESFFLFTK
jgi:hypothetical protein